MSKSRAECAPAKLIMDAAPHATATITPRSVLLATLLHPVGWTQAARPKVDFLHPPRDYSPSDGLAQAYVETSLLRGHKALAERS